MQPFLALITPLSMPEQPGQPPGIWGPPGPWPSPPIHLPPGWASGNPPGIWGGGNVPMPSPPIANVPGAPGYQPNPPGIWGGGNVPMPNPPIANVPGLPPMGPNYPRPPLVIWGGGNVPFPEHPISGVPGAPGYQPPVDGGEQPEPPKFDAKVGWSESTGWVVVFVPAEGTLVPTPSDASKE